MARLTSALLVSFIVIAIPASALADVLPADVAGSAPTNDTTPRDICGDLKAQITPVSAHDRDFQPSALQNDSETRVRTELTEAICNVRSLRGTIHDSIARKRKQQIGFDSSIIATGIAGSAAAIFAASVPVIGGFALAGTGIGAFRNFYSPEKIGSKYITAYKAVQCVSSNAEALLGYSPSTYWDQMAYLKKGIANVMASSANLTGTSQADTDGKNAALSAKSAAEKAYSSLQTEALAYNNAPSLIDQAHDIVKSFTVQSEHLADTDYATVTSQLSSAETAAAQSSAANQTAATQLVTASVAQGQATGSSNLALTSASAAAIVPALPAPSVSVDEANQPGGGKSIAQSLATSQSAQTPEPELTSPSILKPRATGSSPSLKDTDAVLAALNAKAVADLNSQTETAVTLNPTTPITAINAAIAKCVAGLAS